MKLKKIIATTSAMLMLTSTMAMGVFAEETGGVPTVDGKYNATLQAMRDGSDEATVGTSLSMASGVFIDTADVTIAGDEATIDVYIANPLPNFSAEGATLADVVLTDVNSAPLPTPTYLYEPNIADRPIAVTGPNLEPNMMGTAPNTAYACDVLTFTVPTSVLNDSHINIAPYVSLMASNVEFDLVLSNYRDYVKPEADISFSQSDLTAEVVASPTYSVSIPMAINLGTVNFIDDVNVAYNVSVDIDFIEDGKQVSVGTNFMTPMVYEHGTLVNNQGFYLGNYFGVPVNLENFYNYIETPLEPLSTTKDVTWNATLATSPDMFAKEYMPSGTYAGSMTFRIAYEDIPVVENP